MLEATDAGSRLPSQEAAVRYVIDAKLSIFMVHAFSSGILGAFGHDLTIEITDFKGEVQFAPDAFDQAYLRLAIASSSLRVTNDISDADRQEIQRRMQNDVLEVDRYPEIVYECSRVSINGGGSGRYWVALNGELSLHGVSRNHLVTARLATNGESLRASGEFTLQQRDYGIRPPSIAGGAVTIKDQLKLSFDVVAHKTE
ncbi:MAG TPA: YceI family protein [Terriglobales bacterium]|nr:YceI family protein [Terriglobales bacterium]